MKMLSAVLAAAVLAAPLPARGPAPFVVQETGKRFDRLGDAVRSIGRGDGTILIAPGRYRDCAIVEAGRVAFRAQQPGSVVFDGGICEGKAALVLRGRDAAVDGITFENMASSDGNGAGIRLEKGPLTVMNALFRNSEEGILTADDPAATIRVDRSTFSGLGSCAKTSGCAHSLYVGHYGALIVTRSRFERGAGGHYVKSRATRIEVSDSNFDDSGGHGTNYMIDLPAGAVGTIGGNSFVQGKDKDNHSAFVAVAAEARENRSAGLLVAGNKASLAPGVPWPPTFVADWSHEPLALGQNQLGKGIGAFELR